MRASFPNADLDAMLQQLEQAAGVFSFPEISQQLARAWFHSGWERFFPFLLIVVLLLKSNHLTAKIYWFVLFGCFG